MSAAGAGRDPGLYGPASEAWRLNREAMLLLGAGPRALLMQIAHPAVAAGVDQHSDFQADPWRRLAASLRSYLTIVYGTTTTARSEIRRLNEVHRGITGPGYTARDPELSLWVHATLVDSTIVSYDAWLAPLSRARRARFYEETRPIGRAFGVPDRLLPTDLAGFEAYLELSIGPEGPVKVSATARELAKAILRPPVAPLARWLPRGEALQPVLERVPVALYAWTLWPSIALLPEAIRTAFGLPLGPREQLVAGWLVAAWRAWRPLMPIAFRQMPQALAADRRMEAADQSRSRSRSARHSVALLAKSPGVVPRCWRNRRDRCARS